MLFPFVPYFKSSATDVSAQATMKGVAKCDKHFELQSSVSQQNLERMLRFQEILESTPASVPTTSATSLAFVLRATELGCVLLRVKEPCALVAFSASLVCPCFHDE